MTAFNHIGTPTVLFVYLEGFFSAHLIHLLRGNVSLLMHAALHACSAVAWEISWPVAASDSAIASYAATRYKQLCKVIAMPAISELVSN